MKKACAYFLVKQMNKLTYHRLPLFSVPSFMVIRFVAITKVS